MCHFPSPSGPMLRPLCASACPYAEKTSSITTHTEVQRWLPDTQQGSRRVQVALPVLARQRQKLENRKERVGGVVKSKLPLLGRGAEKSPPFFCSSFLFASSSSRGSEAGGFRLQKHANGDAVRLRGFPNALVAERGWRVRDKGGVK